jgi:hypothetical protein
MSLAIERAALFIADFEIQFAWYVEKAGADVALAISICAGRVSSKTLSNPISAEFGILTKQSFAMFAPIK